MSEDQELREEVLSQLKEYKALKSSCSRLKYKSAKKIEEINKLQKIKSSKLAELDYVKDKSEQLNTDYFEFMRTHGQDPDYAPKADTSIQFMAFTRMKIYRSVKDRIEEMINDKIERNFYAKFDQNFSNIIEADEQEQEEENKYYQKPAICSALAIAYERETKLLEPGQDEATEEADTKIEQFFITIRLNTFTTFDDLRIVLADFWVKRKRVFDVEGIKNPNSIEFFHPTKTDEMILSKKEVDKYFKGRGQDQINNKKFIMRVNQDKKDLAIGIEHNQEEEKKPVTMIDEFTHLTHSIPKLLTFLELDRTMVDQVKEYKKNWRNPKAFNENHFCLLFMMLLILILTIASILNQRKSIEAYDDIAYLDENLNVSGMRKISTLDELLQIMIGFSSLFSVSTDLAEAFSNQPIRLIRPLELRLYRVQTKSSCKYTSKTCYEEFYNSETRDTTTLSTVSGLVVFNYFLDDTIEYTGSFGEYSRQAFAIQFDPKTINDTVYIFTMCNILATTSTSKTLCMAVINTLCAFQGCQTLALALQYNFATVQPVIDDAVRAIVLSADFFEVANQLFYHIEPYCEISIYGLLLPQNLRVIPYYPNFNQKSDLDGNINIVFGFIGVFMIGVICYNIFATNRGINIRYLMTFTGLFNLLAMVLMFWHISEINSLNSRGITFLKLVTEYSLVEDLRTYNIATTYEKIMLLKGMLGGVAIVRIAMFFKLNSRVEVIITALERGLPSFVMLAGFIIAYVIMLSYFGNVIFGINIVAYNTLTYSISSMFSLMLGFNNSEFDDPLTQTSFLYLIFVVFGLYLLVPSIAYAIYVESMRFTVLSFGYEFHGKESHWTWRQYFIWAFSWVPRKIEAKLQRIRRELRPSAIRANYRKLKKKIEEMRKKKKQAPPRTNPNINKKDILDMSDLGSSSREQRYSKVRYVKK